MSNNKVGDGRHQKDSKVGNNRVDNNGDQDDWRATIENVVDFDDGIINVLDLTDRIFAKVLTQLFGFLLPKSNLLPSISAVCTS